MNDQEFDPLGEAEALEILEQAFAPLQAGGKFDRLQNLLFRVVDSDGHDILATHPISEHVWRDRTDLRDQLLLVREIIKTHSDHKLDPW